MAWNTFAEWTEARCLASIDHLQTQLAAGASQITGPGGGAQFLGRKDARHMVWELRCQVASLRGEPRPAPPPEKDTRRQPRHFRVDYDGGY